MTTISYHTESRQSIQNPLVTPATTTSSIPVWSWNKMQCIFFLCEIHEMQVKIYWSYCIFWTTVIKEPKLETQVFSPFKTQFWNILSPSTEADTCAQCQHFRLAVEYCSLQLWVLPVESLLTAFHWDSLRGKHSREALPCHPRLPPNFSSNPFYLLYSFWSHFITEQFSR